jgi:DNA anti-recombination protein RmuC
MKDNTSQMNETTKTLLDKTGEMKDKLGEMSKTTDELDTKMEDLLGVAKEDLAERMRNVETNMAELFDSMRQGDGSALRRNAFEYSPARAIAASSGRGSRPVHDVFRVPGHGPGRSGC